MADKIYSAVAMPTGTLFMHICMYMIFLTGALWETFGRI